MSSGDFAAQLRQSVADHLALIETAARAAKARIGEAVPAPVPGVQPAVAFDVPEPPQAPQPPQPPQPRAAVNFFADEDDSFASALAGAPESIPEGAIAFDDAFSMEGVDDEGIPVWEDAS